MRDTARGGVRLPYLPALDGLRGLALLAILLHHGGVTVVRGGHLALTAFFTLSGFLITALLLVERHRTGTVDLRQFWVRRARRLVPALLVTFPLVAVVVLLSESAPGSGLLLDAVAAATWVANWRFVLSEQTYADLFSLPSPFQHFWSLAVEEQFYLVFPLLLLGVLGLRRARPRTGLLALVLGLLVVASTVQLALLHAADGPLGRAYYGTDARLAEILVGSLLALALVGPQGLRPLGRRTRAAVGGAGLAGLAGLLVLFVVLDKAADVTYRGGFLLAAVCTAAVVAAGTQPGSVVTRALSLRPLVRLGLVSYGVYLFHWPLFLLLTESQTGLSTGPLLALRVTVVLLLAFASYAWLEAPVRTGGLPALPALGSWVTGAVAGVVVVAAASTAVTLVPAPAQEVRAAGSEATTATLPPMPEESAVAVPSPDAVPVPGAAPTAPAPAAAPPPPKPAATRAAPPPRGAVPEEFTQRPEDAPVPTVPPRAPDTLRVAVLGDSISQNMATGLILLGRERRDLQTVSFALSGCPISRGGERRISEGREFPISPECSWWDDPSSDRWKAFAELDPHVVVLQGAISESFDRKLPDWGDWRSPGHPQYDQWLLSEYRTAAQRLGSLGAAVLLENGPCSDWDRFPYFREMENGNERVVAVNRVLRLVTGVQLVDLYRRVCPNGTFEKDVEGVENGRDDGFHFTDEAALALARNWLGPIVYEAGAAQRSSPSPSGQPAPAPTLSSAPAPAASGPPSPQPGG
jgi:peptidoglycan/LPS O-acetylase OafA/YrhL